LWFDTGLDLQADRLPKLAYRVLISPAAHTPSATLAQGSYSKPAFGSL